MDGGGHINSYRDLLVWQRAIDNAEKIYEVTKVFPRDELYGMTSQMRRSAVSIAANIAEGYGRESTGAYIQFLKVAQGSLKELETHVVIATRLSFLEKTVETGLLLETDEIGKMLRGLIRSLQRKQSN